MKAINLLMSDIYEWESSTGLPALEKIIRSKYVVRLKHPGLEQTVVRGQKKKKKNYA